MIDRKLRIGVIFGGRSGEHEVSLMSARSILAALDQLKYDVTQIGISSDGSWWVGDNVLDTLISDRHALSRNLTPATILPDPSRPELFTIRTGNLNSALRTGDNLTEVIAGDRVLEMEILTGLDVVFPVLHGTFGEDGTLQGVLEMADLAYVGAGVLGSALGMDKMAFKDIMRANGIPVVETALILRSEIENQMESVVTRSEQLAPYPLFVKPVNLGSSVGITKCRSRSDLIEGLLEAARYDRRVMVERGLEAREIEVSILGNDRPEVSIPGEIISSREFYSYEAKYIDNRSELVIPAPISPNLTERVRELAVRAYRAIDCAGMARVDFLLEKAPRTGDGLYLSEVNTIPGFTNISMYPKLWEASGLSYRGLVDRLIELALQRKKDRDLTDRQYKKEN
jgi:D-alanine-D-alanine ligase